MAALLLIIITICSFLFYGVVGPDKIWVLAPAYLFSYAGITIVLLKRAWGIWQRAGRHAQGDRRMGHGDRQPTANSELPTASTLFLLFLLWGISMIPLATVPFEAKLRMLFIGGVIGAYLVWGAAFTTFRDNRILVGFLILVVMLLALYGLVIHFKAPLQILWAERYAEYPGRLASTYICPNHFAHLMQMLMPFCLALLFIPQSGMIIRILSAYSFIAFLPALFLTESRAGWLGAIAAVGVTICLMALRRSQKLFLLLVIFVPLCSMLLLWTGWRFSETFQRRAEPVVQFLQGQAEDGIGSEAKDFRPQTWMDTIDMISEAPLIGFGPGNYRYTYPEHRKRFRGTRIVTGHPHNEYLELIADFGLVGFGLFALAWIYGLIRILKASLRAEEARHALIGFAFLGAAAGTMVHSFFDFQMHVFPNALVFALLATIAAAPLNAARRKHRRSLKASDPLNVEGGDQRAEGGKQEVAISHEPLADHATPPAVTHQQSASALRAPLCSPWLNKVAAWFLAVTYLLLTVFCVQAMGSSYLRALGDKRTAMLGLGDLARGDKHAETLYAWAVKIDPQNWRAYKGMANLAYNQRYYSLAMEEKVQLAGQERQWIHMAYTHNPKNPETCSAYGKALLFLGRAEGRGHGAGGMEQSAFHLQSALGSELSITANSTLLTSNQKIERGLDLLREACAYRPFNDVYWWSLGIELRKMGLLEEALDVFRRAQSIRRNPSTSANIRWIEAMLARPEPRPYSEDAKAPALKVEEMPEMESWLLPDTAGDGADAELMDLFKQMEQ
jgi:O-antigen ligase